MTNIELADEIERELEAGRIDWWKFSSIEKRQQIIAALRRSDSERAFDAEKHFLHGKLSEKLERACAERQPSSDQVLKAARAWKKAGDAMAMFRDSPNFDHVLTQNDREILKANFVAAVEGLHAALSAAEADGRKT